MSRISDAVRDAGKKFSGKDAKQLKADGFSKSEIRKIAERHGNVGDRYAGKHDLSGGGSGGGDGGGKQRMYTAQLPGTAGQSVFLNKDGTRLAAGRAGLDYLDDVEGVDRGAGWRALYSGDNRIAKKGSGEKINKYLDRTGYSLTPGKNGDRPVVGYKKITLDRQATDLPWMAMGGADMHGHYLEQGNEYIPIYGDSLKQKREKPGKEETPQAAPREQSAAAPGQAVGLFGDGTEFDVPARSTWDTSGWDETAGDGEADGSGSGLAAGQLISANVFSPSAGSFGGLSDGYPNLTATASTSDDEGSSGLRWSSAWNADAPSWRDGGSEDDGTAFAGSAAFRDRLSRIALS